MAQLIKLDYSTSQTQQRKIRSSFNWINELISPGMNTTGRQRGMQAWEQGAGAWVIAFDWLGLQNSLLRVQSLKQLLRKQTSHVGWRREDVARKKIMWVYQKQRTQMTRQSPSPPLLLPPIPVLQQTLNRTFKRAMKQRWSGPTAGNEHF